MPEAVSAQSASRSALLTLRQEFAEPVGEVTPALLHAQEELVRARRRAVDLMEEQVKTGAQILLNVLAAQVAYYRELETLEVMQAISKKRSISQKELVKIRLTVRSQLITQLVDMLNVTKRNFVNGTATDLDVVEAEALVLKARVGIAALNAAAGR